MSLAPRSPSPRTLDDSHRLLIVRPRSRHELLALALELGNLHAAVEIKENEVLVAPDGPVEEILERLGVPWEARAQRHVDLR